MESYIYKTKGTCSKEIDICIEDGIIKHVSFISGCNGNLQGICRLVEGMPVDAVIEKLSGINCKDKGTSCPDQLTKALMEMKQKMAV